MGEAPLVNDAAAPVVRVQDFVKRYRKRTAVEGVSLAIRRGEIYGLIGPDGAGKSSLMKAVAGVLAFEGGRVEVFGQSIESEVAAERVKGRLGFMPQGLNLYPELSVEENVVFFAELREVPKDALAARKTRLLAMTRLDKFRDRPMKQFSGGMKQKLGLVCTLIHEPELIILDEPTTGVDPVSRRDFWAILTQLLRERGVTALVSTAYLDEAERFARLALLHGGRVLAEGAPEAILDQAPDSLVELVAVPQMEALARLEARFANAEAVGGRIRVFVPDGQAQAALVGVRTLLEGISIEQATASAPSLEDAFIALLQRRQGEDEETPMVAGLKDDPPPGDGVAIESGIFASSTRRVLRSTSTPTADRLLAPLIRSPSQWPGMTRSLTSGERTWMLAISGIWPRRSVPAERDLRVLRPWRKQAIRSLRNSPLGWV